MNRKAADESIQFDVVPRVPKLRTLQRPLESWLCPCRRVLQHYPPDSDQIADISHFAFGPRTDSFTAAKK
jgi:hypothetical protein